MKPPIITGIAGGSGSGKTTLAEGLCRLTEDYGSVLFSLDDYYRGLPEGTRAGDVNFDEPDALDLDRFASDLATLRSGRPVRRPVYDFVRHRRSDADQETGPAPLIVVEGLFLFVRPELCELFDFRFFVDVPAQERLHRRIRRDVRNRGRGEAEVRDQWDRQVEPMYVRHILPTRASAHFVLDLPRPDDLAYSEQVVAMWGMVERRLQEDHGMKSFRWRSPNKSIPSADFT